MLFVGVLTTCFWLTNFFPSSLSFFNQPSLSINTSLMFIILSLLLLCRENSQRSNRHLVVIGACLSIGFCLTILSQDIFTIDLGIDQLLVNSTLSKASVPHPGRIPPQTTICFLIASLAIILVNVRQRVWLAHFIQLLCFVIFITALISVFGHFIPLEYIYEWYKFAKMSTLSALGLVLLSIAIWTKWYRLANQQKIFRYAKENRIFAVGTAILSAIALTAGMSVFYIFLSQVENTIEKSFKIILDAHVNMSKDEIDDAIETSSYISRQLYLVDNIKRFNENKDEQLLTQLKTQLDLSINTNLQSIRVYDSDNHLITQHGDVIVNPEINFKLNEIAHLIWNNKTYLEVKAQLKQGDKLVGSIITQHKLVDVNSFLKYAENLGNSGEIRICSASNQDEMSCLPSRYFSKVLTQYPRTLNNKPLIMDYALEGRSGYITTQDYQGTNVVAAYAPIAPYNLGMLVKMDTLELYLPVKKHLNKVFCLLIVLILIGTVLLRYQWAPLIKKIFISERELRNSNKQFEILFEYSSDAHLLVNEKEGIIDCNRATLEMLNCPLKSEIIGINPFVLSPEFQPDGQKSIDKGNELIKLAYEHGYYQSEWVHLQSDGSHFPVEIALTHVTLKEEPALLIVWHDLTARKEFEQKILESEERLKLFIKHTPAAVAMFDNNMNYIMASDRWLKDYHLEQVDLAGKSHFEVFPEIKDIPRWMSVYKLGLEGHVQSAEEECWRRADGTIEWIKWAIHPWRAAGSKIGGIVMFTEVITQRKLDEQALRLSEERLQSIMNSSYHSIIVTDLKGIITMFNPASERMLGYSADEVIGKMTPANFYDRRQIITRAKKLSKRSDSRNRPGFKMLISGLAEKGFIQQEWSYVRKDGSKVPVMLSITALHDTENNIIGYVGLGVDISERKILERMKNEFISTVSHELRTPLTSIRGSLGLLISGISNEASDRMKNLLDIAYKNCERLILLINDILDLEKIELGEMRFDLKRYNIKDLILQAIELNKVYAEKFDIEYVVSRPLFDQYVYVDSDRIIQVLTNLMSNAAKFSPAGSKVEISMELIGEKVRVCVTDHGIGIPESFKPRIFGKFAQADGSNTKKQGGTGLGLNISKIIIEQFDGSINFESELDKGSTFYFDLNVVLNPPPARPEREPTLKLRVLVCEDDKDIAEILKYTLESHELSVDIAYSLQQARDYIAQNNYIALTLDLELPDGNGIDLIRELRETEKTKKLPIIVVSATSTKDKKNPKGQAIDVVDWLTKPIDTNRLVATVKEIKALNRKPRILHIEDDEDVAHIIAYNLSESADITQARTLEEARIHMKNQEIDLVLLDITLPDGNGLKILEDQMDGFIKPIIILSSTEVDHKIKDKVAAALVKSKTTEEIIVKTIQQLISQTKNGEGL